MQDMLKDINQHTETIKKWAHVVESVDHTCDGLKTELQTLQRQLATSIDNNTTFAEKFVEWTNLVVHLRGDAHLAKECYQEIQNLHDKVHLMDNQIRILQGKVDFLEEKNGHM